MRRCFRQKCSQWGHDFREMLSQDGTAVPSCPYLPFCWCQLKHLCNLMVHRVKEMIQWKTACHQQKIKVSLSTERWPNPHQHVHGHHGGGGKAPRESGDHQTEGTPRWDLWGPSTRARFFHLSCSWTWSLWVPSIWIIPFSRKYLWLFCLLSTL